MKSHFYILNCSSLSCEPNSCKKNSIFLPNSNLIKNVTKLKLEKISNGFELILSDFVDNKENNMLVFAV